MADEKAPVYTRFAARLDEAALKDNVLSGVAHTFGTKVMRFGRWETFSKGAFTKVFKNKQTDARAFVNHNPDLLLGRQSAKTLTIEATDDNLKFSIDLPNTSYANDLKESVRRGDLDGVSFGIVPGKFVETFDQAGIGTLMHTEVSQFIDISPCALPAFDGTSIELNAAEIQELMRAAETPAPEPTEKVVAFIDAKTQAIQIRHLWLFGGPGSGPRPGVGGIGKGHSTHGSLKEPGDLQRHLLHSHGLHPTDLRGGNPGGAFLSHETLKSYHGSMHA